MFFPSVLSVLSVIFLLPFLHKTKHSLLANEDNKPEVQRGNDETTSRGSQLCGWGEAGEPGTWDSID